VAGVVTAYTDAVTMFQQSAGTLLTQYLEKYWTYFHQFSATGAFWDMDKYVKFWVQMV